MRQVKFTGYVAPRGIMISVQITKAMQAHHPEYGQILATVSVVDSQIEVLSAVDHLADGWMQYLWGTSVGLAEAAVGLVALREGEGVQVIIDSYQLPDEEQVMMKWQDLRLPDICTALAGQSDFDEVFRLTIGEPRITFAIHDAVGALINPFATLLNCGRCIETIRGMITRDLADRKQAWPMMHTALNCDRAYCDLITEHSTGPRHGNPIDTDRHIRPEVILRTWTLMNRFLHYRRRGNHPLSGEEFPLLKG